jgi:hypothetical protein
VGGGWQAFSFSPETTGRGRKCEMGRCDGETARSVVAKVRGDVFTRIHAVAAQLLSRTRNSQFGLLGPVLRATTTAVWMAAPVRNILDITSHLFIYLRIFRITPSDILRNFGWTALS